MRLSFQTWVVAAVLAAAVALIGGTYGLHVYLHEPAPASALADLRKDAMRNPDASTLLAMYLAGHPHPTRYEVRRFRELVIDYFDTKRT